MTPSIGSTLQLWRRVEMFFQRSIQCGVDQITQRGLAVTAGMCVSALIIAFGVSTLAGNISWSQGYSDFIVGHLAWRDESKSGDFLQLAVFWLTFFTVLAALGHWSFRITRGGQDGDTLRVIDNLLMITLIPAAWYLGTELVTTTATVRFIWLASVSGLFALLTLGAFSRLKEYGDASQTSDVLFGMMLLIFFSLIAGMAFSTFLSRAFEFTTALGRISSPYLMQVGLLFSISIIFVLFRSHTSLSAFRERLLRAILFFQLPGALLLFVLIPPFWNEVETTSISRPMVSPFLFFALYALVIASLAELYRLWKRAESKRIEGLESVVASSFCIAVLVFVHTPAAGVLHISLDDYHVGERYLPWTQWWDFGKIPFVDLTAVHGFIHIVRGMLNSFFFAGTAASYESANALLFAVAVAINFIALRHLAGPLPAFILTYGLCNSFFAFWFIVPAMVVLLNPWLRASPLKWLFVWVALSLASVLYVLSTGLAFVIGTFPFAAWMLWRSVRLQRTLTLIAAVSTGLLFLFLTWISPIDEILAGLIWYVQQNAGSNSTAYGIALEFSKGDVPIHRGLFSAGDVWNVLRFGWIAMVPIFIFVAWKQINRNEVRDSQVAMFCMMAVGFLVAFASYSFGRIDPGGLSRTGATTVWVWSTIVPVAILLHKRKRFPIAGWVLFSIFSSMAFQLADGRPFPSPNELEHRSSSVMNVAQANIVDGSALGLPGLGKAEINRGQLESLLSLRDLLNQTLRPGETFLDVSNRSARYFYLGYPLPTFELAMYNAPATDMQRKIIEQIRAARPPMVLLESGNLQFDGGPVSLRANLIYRDILLNYVPVKWGTFIIGLSPKRFRELASNVDGQVLPVDEITDGNWTRGISNNPESAGFVVKNSILLDSIKPGDILLFPKSGSRTVRQVIQDQIWVHGASLVVDDSNQETKIQVVPSIVPRGESELTIPSEFKLSLLDRAFQVRHLENIPAAWGRSYENLLSKLERIAEINQGDFTIVHSVHSPSSSRYDVVGDDPYLVADISKLNLRGVDVAFLSFAFACESGQSGTTVPELEIYWNSEPTNKFDESRVLRFNGHSGTLLVPIDVNPRWLLSPRLAQIRFDVADRSCKSFTLGDFRMYQRQHIRNETEGRT